ncbi:hypothetical protein V8C37DRAFT_45459 [Trichoderma ceciliae]
MTPSIKPALIVGALAYITVGNPLPQWGHPWSEHTSYCTTSFEVVTAAERATFARKYCSGFSKLPLEASDRRRNVRRLDEAMDFVDFDDDAGVLFQGDEDDGENCTARVFQVPKINLGPTRTVFTTTTTASRIVDCGTCTNASPIPIPLGVPPVAIFKTTVTAKEPYTETELVCGATTNAPSEITKEGVVTVNISEASPRMVVATAATTTAAPSQVSAQSIVASTDFPSGIVVPDCVLSYALQLDRLDLTSTVYTSTVTRTSHRACGPCALVWWTAPHEHTITSFVKTVTKKEPKVVTALACSDD